MQKQRVAWDTREGLALVLDFILGGFFTLTLVQNRGGEPLQLALVALLGLLCLGGAAALVLRLRSVASGVQGGAAVVALALSGTLAAQVLVGGDRFVLPYGLMIVVALAGFAGLFAWLAVQLKKLP